MDPTVFSVLNDDMDFLVLALEHKKRRKLARHIKTGLFNLEAFDDEDSDFNFRFTKSEILRLFSALEIPPILKCRNGTTFRGLEGLCILLRRLAYPNRLGELTGMFFRTKSELSLIFNTMINWILDKFGFLLTTLDKFWLSEPYLRSFSQAIQAKGSPLPNCWGMIDGTVRAICRPGKNQRACYNGHKRKHALKFQSVVTPNGMIAHLFGPIEGRRHDCFLLKESNFLRLSEDMKMQSGESYYVYGDPAYPLRPQLQGPFKGGVHSPDEAEFNTAMSLVRASVEWEFGKITTLFAFADFQKN